METYLAAAYALLATRDMSGSPVPREAVKVVVFDRPLTQAEALDRGLVACKERFPPGEFRGHRVLDMELIDPYELLERVGEIA